MLCICASKHGSTFEIAERLTEVLRSAGHDVELHKVRDASDPSGFDAVLVGSAVYSMRWMPEASAFIRAHRSALSECPVWLFSSGPLGSAKTDSEGRDIRDAAEPKEIAEFVSMIQPRAHRVFWGALDPGKLGLGARLARLLPAARAMMPQGDFRDWGDVEAWAHAIVNELSRTKEEE